jgi:uncharacterized protein (TIGR03067 family)
MRTRLLLLTAVFAGLLWLATSPPTSFAAPVPKGMKNKLPDAEAFHGTWQAVRVEAGDEQLRAAFADAVFVFRKRTLTLRAGGEDVIDQGVYSLSHGAGLKVLTWDNDEGDPHTALYELDGDTLRICSVFDESDTPPTVFDAKANRAIVTLKRLKTDN